MSPLPCTEGPLNEQRDGRDTFNGKTSLVGGAVVSTGWRRAPLVGGLTVWVAIVGSGGTKGPLLGGPIGGLRAGASLEV